MTHPRESVRCNTLPSSFRTSAAPAPCSSPRHGSGVRRHHPGHGPQGVPARGPPVRRRHEGAWTAAAGRRRRLADAASSQNKKQKKQKTNDALFSEVWGVGGWALALTREERSSVSLCLVPAILLHARHAQKPSLALPLAPLLLPSLFTHSTKASFPSPSPLSLALSLSLRSCTWTATATTAASPRP
jgi:hypothetical protein